MRATKLQIWHLGSLNSGALRLEKSEGTFVEPGRCLMLIWYLLMVDKNDMTRRLAENSLRQFINGSNTRFAVGRYTCLLS